MDIHFVHALREWSDKWLLCFHPEKCKAMRIGKSRIDKMDYTLKEGLPPMEYVESEKDIGVVIDNKLTFNRHSNIFPKRSTRLIR